MLIVPALLVGSWAAAAAVALATPASVALRALRRRTGRKRNTQGNCARCSVEWSAEDLFQGYFFDGVRICSSCAETLKDKLSVVIPVVWLGVAASLGLSLVGYLTRDPSWVWYWNGLLVPSSVIVLAPTVLLGGGFLLRLRSGRAANAPDRIGPTRSLDGPAAAGPGSSYEVAELNG